MKKTMIAKKSAAAILAAALAASMMAGCGKADTAAQDASAEATQEAVEQEAEAQEPEAAEEAVEEEGVTPPFLKAVEQYDSILSGLRADQYYAFADICEDYDVLLVTDYVYDNLDGNMAAIDAVMYGLDSDGNPVELGQAFSDGTAYPLAVYDGCLMYGGNHRMSMVFVSKESGSVITKKDVHETFDTDGNATYYLFDYDAQFEGEVEDDAAQLEMYRIYGDAVVLNFTPVSGQTAAAGTSYVHTFEEEMEGETLEFQDIIVLNDDNTCMVTFQDTIPGVWTEDKIVMDNGEELEIKMDGDVLQVKMFDEWVPFTME